jgi:hypothetical protein
MKKTLFVALLCCMYLSIFAQTITIEGTINDASDDTPLPYVNIYLKGSNQGTYTDLKGNFTLTIPQTGGVLAFSYIGYEKKEITVTKNDRLTIKLKPLLVSLEETIITPGENPADVIMRKVTDNRKKHDPENLQSFSFRTYNKFVVNINRNTDSAFFNNIDTLDSFEDTLVNKMNLFLMESITDKLYKKPGNYKETVQASRVSGLKNGQYVLLANEIQSFSFYKNYVQVLGKEYLSPIAEGNTRKYLFVLQDTVDVADERAYLIYYQPRKGKNFDGLSGLLYINTENFAVLKATAKAADGDGFTTQVVQNYTKMGDDTYFPTLFTSDFTFAQVKIEVPDSASKKPKNLMPVGKAKTTLYKIDLNPELKRKQFDNIELDYAPDALTKDDKFWDENRQEKLDSKDSLTYQIIDSVGKELNLDRRLEFLRMLQTGKWAVGPLNIHLDDIFRFNNFEGARPGLKVSTNDRLSRRFSVGGYYAYGFKDVHSKYGGNFTLFFNKSQSSALDFMYSNDVAETGLQPVAQREVISEERLRSVYINVMDRVERSKVTASTRLLRYITAEAGFETVNKKVTTAYRFGDGNQQYFKFTNAVVSLRWAPFEKLVRSFGSLRAKDSKWPVMYATFTKGFSNVLNGQFDFLRTDVMAEYDVRIRNAGRSYFRVLAGNVDGTVPYTEMYFGRAGFNNKNLSIVTPWAFETMRYNEFFGNQYAAFFFRHDFGSLLFKTKKFQPTILLVTNAYVSTFSNPNAHKNFALNAANKGFYESGIQINNIFKVNFAGYGVGAFYRYGPYSFDKPSKNLAIKLSLTSTFN